MEKSSLTAATKISNLRKTLPQRALFPNPIKNDKSLLIKAQHPIFQVNHAWRRQIMVGINLPKRDKRVPVTVLTGFLGAGALATPGMAGETNRFSVEVENSGLYAHMLFGGEADRPWKMGEERHNPLIFIGRNRDRAALNAGFRACLA